MASKITLETLDGAKKLELVHAYGLVFNAITCSMLPEKDLAKHIETVQNLEIRDDDVYLATYPRSGTHWAWEIIMMLRKGTAEYEKKDKNSVFLDFATLEQLADAPSNRVLNSHYPVKLIPQGVFKKKIKIIHVQRNPKDVLISFYQFIKAGLIGGLVSTFGDFQQLMIGAMGIYLFYPWFKFVKEWETFTEKHPEQILNLYYEDMKEDPVREIKKIDTFLKCNNSDEVIEQIAEACSFDNLKKAEFEVKETTLKQFDSVMYRKGEVGDWKNWFTVAQNEMVDEWLSENLVHTNLKFRYGLK